MDDTTAPEEVPGQSFALPVVLIRALDIDGDCHSFLMDPKQARFLASNIGDSVGLLLDEGPQ